jgi:hypothetical protein
MTLFGPAIALDADRPNNHSGHKQANKSTFRGTNDEKRHSFNRCRRDAVRRQLGDSWHG